MSTIFGIVKETYILDTTRRTSYGIVAFAQADGGATATIVAAERDISTKKRPVEKLAALCNKHSLSPIHLSSVVEDFLFK